MGSWGCTSTPLPLLLLLGLFPLPHCSTGGGGQEAPQHLRSPLSLQPPRWVWNPIARGTPAVCLSAHIRTAGRGGTRRGGEEEGKGGAEGFGRVSLH